MLNEYPVTAAEDKWGTLKKVQIHCRMKKDETIHCHLTLIILISINTAGLHEV